MPFLDLPRDPRLASVGSAVVRVAGGAGVVIQPEQAPCILTAEHVVRDHPVPQVRWAGGASTTTIYRADRSADLALLACPQALARTPVSVLNAEHQVHVADTTWIIGFPNGWDDRTPVYSSGVVGGVGQETWINADGTWGNSGGPVVVDVGGELKIAGLVLSRGGKVEAALEQTTSDLRGVVHSLSRAGGGASVQIMGIDFGKFAAFSADGLRIACEFIENHFRSGYVRIATADAIRGFLAAR